MTYARAERVALNEATGRSINEYSKGIRPDCAGIDSEPAGFVCECGDAACDESVHMDSASYEVIRQDPCLFLVRRGHEITDVEDVVRTGDDFTVVRKHSDVAGVVRATDPRRQGS